MFKRPAAPGRLMAPAVAVLALLLDAPLIAQGTGASVIFPAGYAPGVAPCVKQPDGSCKPVSAADPLIAADANNAPYAGAQAMTVGTTYPAQRGLGASCTASGTAVVTLSDSSSVTVGLIGAASPPTWQSFPFAVKAVASTTATCTFYNLK